MEDALLYKEEIADMQRQHEQDKYKISYKRMEGQLIGGEHDCTSTTSVKTSILKSCYNGLVRPVWEGPVINVRHSNYDKLPTFVQDTIPDPSNESTTHFSSSLAFPLMLGDTISRLQNEAESLRKQKQKLNAETLRWKSTVDKLMNQWQDEKSELTQNFLTLFNEHKARHVETLQKLEALTKHESNNTAMGTLSNKKTKKRDEREAVPDDEEQHDYADWDQDMVDRLAAGPKNRNKIAKKVKMEDREYTMPASDDTFRDPVTGVMMVTDHTKLFSDDDEGNEKVARRQRNTSLCTT